MLSKIFKRIARTLENSSLSKSHLNTRDQRSAPQQAKQSDLEHAAMGYDKQAGKENVTGNYKSQNLDKINNTTAQHDAKHVVAAIQTDDPAVSEDRDWPHPNSDYATFMQRIDKDVSITKKWTASEREELCTWLVHNMITLASKADALGYNVPEAKQLYDLMSKAHDVFELLMCRAQNIPVSTILDWQERAGKRFIHSWPYSNIVKQIERRLKQEALSERDRQGLVKLAAQLPKVKEQEYGPDFKKVQDRLAALLAEHASGEHKSQRPYELLAGDDFGQSIISRMQEQTEADREKWHAVFHAASNAEGSKPAKRFMEAAQELETLIGKSSIRAIRLECLQYALKANHISTPYETSARATEKHHYLTKENATLVKGLVWMCAEDDATKTIHLIADLGAYAMKPLQGQGPASRSVANACVWYLEQTPRQEALSKLASFVNTIDIPSFQEMVEEILYRKAHQQELTVRQLIERAVPDFGLVDGKKTISFGDLELSISVAPNGKVTRIWRNQNGKIYKSKPGIVSKNEQFARAYQNISDTVRQIKKTISAERKRIDRLFAEDVSWSVLELETHYMCHGLLCVIAKGLIWAVETSQGSLSAMYRNGEWRSIDDTIVTIDASAKVRLWHPLNDTIIAVIDWRDKLEKLNLVQPLKQAYREVYVLTDAERRTEVYSNRMAAHIIKQHQAHRLLLGRNWNAEWIMVHDTSHGEFGEYQTKTFETSSLNANFICKPVLAEGEFFNEVGTYLYISTDQINFSDGDGQIVSLDRVPKRIFSEVMRDIDMVLGVSSVGNDPYWFDQGPTVEATQYWEQYAFGNLDGFAAIRKEVIQKLLPRLKLRDVAHIEGNFLIVDGQINTYKIHLRSGNVLITPEDHYLCIVPESRTKNTRSDIDLPFEDDTQLSLILSKAFLLAEDAKIQDELILNQLRSAKD